MGAGRPEKRNEKGAIAPFALACFAFRRQLHYPVYAHFACRTFPPGSFLRRAHLRERDDVFCPPDLGGDLGVGRGG